ncbi:hypothetical protein ACFFTK_23975 [Pseudonocardia petroleophila]
MGRELIQYWPLAATLPIVGILHAILVAVNDTWSAKDWASNIVFAYVVTVATVILANRQARTQRSAAASVTLLEKRSTVAELLGLFSADLRAGTASQIMIEMRAGASAYGSAEKSSRTNYLKFVAHAASDVHRSLTESVRAYTVWETDDWNNLVVEVQELKDEIESAVQRNDDQSLNTYPQLQGRLNELLAVPPVESVIPFEIFRASYENGDVYNRIQVGLKWQVLAEQIQQGAKITVHRAFSVKWFEENTVLSVWCAAPDGGPSDSAAPGAKPVEFDDTRAYMAALEANSTFRVGEMASALGQKPGGKIQTTVLVTLELGPNRLLVLDGNHRAAAIRRGRGDGRPLEVQIVECRITGASLDEQMLPDLRLHPPAS